MKKKGTICWDSCVIISHFNGDRNKNPERKPRIDAVVSMVDGGNYKLLVSAILYVEVLETKMSQHTIDKFNEFMRRIETITIMAVDLTVAKKAQSLRDRIPKLKTPDAIHIATAIVGGAKVFHTFDDLLLDLSKQSEVDNLIITPC